MVKFGDAVNLFCTYIKTVLMLFIVNFLISIPVGFIIGICSIIKYCFINSLYDDYNICYNLYIYRMSTRYEC